MKRVILRLVFLFTVALVSVSCRETKKETEEETSTTIEAAAEEGEKPEKAVREEIEENNPDIK